MNNASGPRGPEDASSEGTVCIPPPHSGTSSLMTFLTRNELGTEPSGPLFTGMKWGEHGRYPMTGP